MQNRFIIFIFIVFYTINGLNAQQVCIKSIDESDYPIIKVNVEFSEAEPIDLSALKVIEESDTLVFSVDSVLNMESNKTICILLARGLLNNSGNLIQVNNTLKTISTLLDENDRMNIILPGKDKKQDCIEPLSFEFTNDFGGLNNYLSKRINSGNFDITDCSIEKTIDFIQSKKNLPTKRLLLVFSGLPENNLYSLPAFRAKAKGNNISVAWLNIESEPIAFNQSDGNHSQVMMALIDSVFSGNTHLNRMKKNVYRVEFCTRQKNKLNQFEIAYKGTKQRSTFIKPGNIDFFSRNQVFIGFMAWFLLLVILFALNMVFTKRQIIRSFIEIQNKKEFGIFSKSPDIKNYIEKGNEMAVEKAIPHLVIEIGNSKTEYDLNRPVTKIGRHPDNDIVIDNMTISGIHASFLIEDGKYYIEDSVSTNGTYVNDAKISKILIKNGDFIRIGKALITFTC